MSKVYVVRHGACDIGDEKRYYGSTDLPLTERGRHEALITANWLDADGVSIRRIFSSPLSRARDTASIMCRQFGLSGFSVVEELREVDLGDWEGLTFREVRERFPEEYHLRGQSPATYTTPHGESLQHAGKRFVGALRKIAAENTGDVAVVAHAGIIRAAICELEQIDYSGVFDIKVATASVTILDAAEQLSVQVTGRLPEQRLDERFIHDMYAKCRTPENVIHHMEAVRRCCDELLDEIEGNFNRERITSAALLHDICRTKHAHAAQGARMIRNEGFDRVADLVELHHDENFDEDEGLSEADILWYADKLCQGERRVTLQERFRKSEEKCLTDEARAHHASRYRKALSIQEKIRRASCGC